jgi:tetratricopeptide (TPR) repeat protein
MRMNPKTGFCIMLVLCVFLSPIVRAEQKEEDPQRSRILEEVKLLFEGSDSYKVIEFVNEQGEPKEVARRYSDLVNDLYWKEKTLSHVVTIARAGIQYSLTKAQEYGNTDSALATEMREAAKIISYNLASYTWPGWDEQGVAITKADLTAGLDAAKVNLRLAKELERELIPLSVAHWALGAQYLALGEYDRAIQAFQSSASKAEEAAARLYVLLARGYTGITMIVEGSRRGEGEDLLDEATEGLNQLGTEDSEYFVQQLKTALDVFTRD